MIADATRGRGIDCEIHEIYENSTTTVAPPSKGPNRFELAPGGMTLWI